MRPIHPNARTTPVTRAAIAAPAGILARRHGASTETVRKWRKRGAADCLDHSARPHRLPWKATEEERAIVCTLRQATQSALDDPTFVVGHVLPHLDRDSVWRIGKAEGPNPPAGAGCSDTCQGPGHVQGRPPRLHPHRHQAPAEAADRGW